MSNELDIEGEIYDCCRRAFESIKNGDLLLFKSILNEIKTLDPEYDFINYSDEECYMTPAMCAIKFDKMNIFKYLTEDLKCNLNVVTYKYMEDVISFCCEYERIEYLKILVQKYKLDVNRSHPYINNYLFFNSEMKDQNLKFPESIVKEYGSSLVVACKRNNYAIVKYLLESGANPNIVNYQTGRTPLMYCGMYKVYDQIVQLLIDYGADPDKVDSKGNNYLDYYNYFKNSPDPKVNQ